MFPKKLPGEDLINSWYPILFALAIGAIYGLRCYFKGPQTASKENLDGKTAVITGANSGVGKEVARDFVTRGCRVILACRDEVRTLAAIEDILLRTKANKKQLVFMKLDLASLASVRSFAEEFNKKEKRLDILVNNAGVVCHPVAKTEDGHELHFGVNYLGHFLLTHLLTDKLKSSAPSRIVNTTALAYKLGEIHLDDINFTDREYNASEAYSQSKLALVLFTRYLSKQLEGTGVSVNVVHPGVVNSDAHRQMPFRQSTVVKFSMAPVLWFLMKTSRDGAQTTIQVATAEEEKDVSGKYYADCRISDVTPNGLDDEVAKKLWDRSMEMCAL